ncbi:hypothetical protein ACFLUP_03360 [Chloroflexota bacterium]
MRFMRKMNSVALKTTRWITLIGRLKGKLHLARLFEPKTLRITEYWISELIINAEGHFDVVEFSKFGRSKYQTLDVAIKHLDEAWKMVEHDKQKQIIVPIWCLDRPDPEIEGVQSLLLDNSSESMNKQIEALRLEEPIDLLTKLGKSDNYGKTIIDVTPARLVILGNVNAIIDYLKSLGRVFVFRQNDRDTAMNQLRMMLISYQHTILHSGMMFAGWGGTFGVVSGVVLSKMLSTNALQPGEIITVFAALMSALVFLVTKAFSSRLVAFSSLWTLKFSTLSWLGFLFLLMSGKCKLE